MGKNRLAKPRDRVSAVEGNLPSETELKRHPVPSGAIKPGRCKASGHLQLSNKSKRIKVMHIDVEQPQVQAVTKSQPITVNHTKSHWITLRGRHRMSWTSAPPRLCGKISLSMPNPLANYLMKPFSSLFSLEVWLSLLFVYRKLLLI